MRCVVTGAGGFLGSHLTDRLLADGYEVVGIDTFLTGDRRNIEHLASHPGFTLVEQDVTAEITIAGHIGAVFHLASPASPSDYLRLPVETLRAGSIGTLNCLDLARRTNAVFLLASTSEVYGDPLVHPQPEDYWGNVSPVGPRGVYDESKRFAEALTTAYHGEYGLQTRIARLFNGYGPRMRPDDGRVVVNFITQALEGQPLTVYGDGSQTRSYCFVNDLVEGLVELFHRGDAFPTNLGNPAECTVRELAGLVIDLTKTASVLTFEPLPIHDPRRRCPDIARARATLGWEPTVSLEEGLARTIPYYRDRLSHA